MFRPLRAWYTFLGLALLTLVFVAFVGTLPLSLSSAVALPHTLPFRAAGNVRGAIASLVDRRDHRAELARLEREVAELARDNRALRVELENLSQIARVRASQSPGVRRTAPVIGMDSSPLVSRLLLGVGLADGVTRDMPVSVPEGLVGIVTSVDRDGASVRTLLDPESRVGVTVRGRGGQGVAIGELGGFIRVTDYDESLPIEAGDTVETSSRGGLFPRGIRVGEVVEVLPKNPNSLRTQFLVRPAAEMSHLIEVALIEPL